MGEDIQDSQEIKIVIPEQQLLTIEDGSIQDSAVFTREQNSAPQPQVISAPLGDPLFWMYFHIRIVDYAIRKFDQEKQLAEIRCELLEAGVAREYLARQEAEKELKKLRTLLALRDSALAESVMALFRADDRNDSLELRLKNTENTILHLSADYVPALIRALAAENGAESKEAIIQMYEKRFGSREKLLKLAEAEQKCEDKSKNCQRTNYDCMDKLIQYHETGKCPKTTGQRMADFMEKLLCPKTYSKIVTALYEAFRGKPKQDDCG